MRSTLFHLILDKAIRESGSGSPESAELEKYKKMLDMAKMSEDEDMVEFVESKIASLVGASSKPVSVSWSDAEDFLADQKEVQLWIKKFYEHFDDRMEMVTHPKLLARLLLLREFNSRPKRQNTLETMGLVAMEYPLLAQKANTAPKEWLRFFDDVEKGRTEWVTFLTLAVNFHVRSLKAVRLTKEQLNWIGAKYQPTLLVAQGESTHIWNVESWPKVTRGGSIQPRLARLLSCAFNIDLDEAYNRAEVNEILRQAWNALQSSVLTPSGDGFRLELEQQVSFSLLKEKNQCPHTQKIIDKPLLGITPYLNASGEREEQLCRRLLTPDYPYPFGRDPKTGESVELAKTREWQEQDALIDIRKENAWSDIADRVIERTPYFRVAEHSAQLKASQLRQYEKDFKEGRSTYSAVRQPWKWGWIWGDFCGGDEQCTAKPSELLTARRSCRSSWRSKSIALTLCKSTPHGEHIFSNTRWAFDTQIKVPNVSLSSEYIVRRHVNSLLLSTFLNKVVSSENNLKLNCGTFFKAGHELTASYAEQFIDWCREERRKWFKVA
uniref:hypothetical protein n=1 Tax=Vibrio cholerae TaxID=666 RepID=UPI003F58D7B9